jgi:hypothetical protein
MDVELRVLELAGRSLGPLAHLGEHPGTARADVLRAEIEVGDPGAEP